MMETVCYPAMEEVAQELRLRGAAVELKSLPPEEGENLGHLDLLVHMGDEQNFIYKIGRSSTRCRALPIGRAAGNPPITGWRPSCWRAVRVTT